MSTFFYKVCKWLHHKNKSCSGGRADSEQHLSYVHWTRTYSYIYKENSQNFSKRLQREQIQVYSSHTKQYYANAMSVYQQEQ